MCESELKLRKSEWDVRPVPVHEAREIICKYHYGRGCSNTAVATHGLYKMGEWLGAECYGVTWWMPPIIGAAKANWHNPSEVLVLSRMVLKPTAPKNSATFLLMRSVKLLPAKWKCLLTYADTWQNHTGTIYRAANWEYLGETKPSPVYVMNGTMRSKKSAKNNFSREEMVKKGELTVKQGKELNEELKRKKQPEKEQPVADEKLDAIMEELSQIKKRLHDLESKSE